jgi:hypothetical protein
MLIKLHCGISCGNKMNRHTDIKRESEPPAELESQFILRIPSVCPVNSMLFHNLNEVFNIKISIFDQLATVFISYALSFIFPHSVFVAWSWQYKQYI